MKLKTLFATLLVAASATTAFGQTHKEGEEYYKADQLNNAKELLQRNMNNAGTDKAISNYYLGLIALREGNKSEAEKYFNAGTEANPDYAFNYVGLGQINLMNGNKKGAEDLFKQAKGVLKNKEEKAALDIAIARAYYNVDPSLYAKEIDKNIVQAQKDSPKQGPAWTDPSIYLFEGDRFKDLKDVGKAANQYEMAANYNPEATEAYVKYANLFNQVNPEYAIQMLNRLLSINPQSALGQRELANAYYNAGKFKEAAEEYNNYIKNPNHFKQDEDRYAFLLFYDKNYQGGYDYATQLLNANPGNFTAQRFQFMNAAQIDAMRDQLLPLAEKLVAAHNANPDNKFAPIDYILIGDELSTAGRPQEAQALFEEAIANDPENPEFYKQLALVFVKENNLPKASDSFQNYIAKREKPTYNDYVQQATYAFYAGEQKRSENDTEGANKYYTMSGENADKAFSMSSDYPKPIKIKGDIAKQTAPENEVGSAAVPLYTQAIAIFEGLSPQDQPRYVSDAKEMYNYMGNYYLDQNDKATALIYFDKYLQLDPDNEGYRKFVDGLR